MVKQIIDHQWWIGTVPPEKWHEIPEYREFWKQEMENWKKCCPVAYEGLKRMGF